MKSAWQDECPGDTVPSPKHGILMAKSSYLRDKGPGVWWKEVKGTSRHFFYRRERLVGLNKLLSQMNTWRETSP